MRRSVRRLFARRIMFRSVLHRVRFPLRQGQDGKDDRRGRCVRVRPSLVGRPPPRRRGERGIVVRRSVVDRLCMLLGNSFVEERRRSVKTDSPRVRRSAGLKDSEIHGPFFLALEYGQNTRNCRRLPCTGLSLGKSNCTPSSTIFTIIVGTKLARRNAFMWL